MASSTAPRAVSAPASAEQLRIRLELRRSSAAARHSNRKRRAAAGSGKGGRAGARRLACAER